MLETFIFTTGKWPYRLLFALSLMCAPVASQAASQSAQICFGTFDLPPYGFYDDKNPRRGMLRDMNSAVAERASLTYTDRVMPLKRINKELVKGGVTCATFLPVPWTKRDLIQVAEIIPNLDSIVVPRKGLSITRLEDLFGLTIAAPRGSYAGTPIMTNPNINRLLTNGYNQSAAILKAGRVDAMAGSEIAVYHSLSVAGVSTSDMGKPFIFLKSPLWLQCRKDTNPAHIERLREAAVQLRAEGAFDQIMAHYAPRHTE
ncbi:MAG: transporter substrate-binding domain-containing protein [Rhodospirillaceae bacterium]|jgi:polar amino acid transport system substrate-binding protein|nr:transporter substrate-binding domain-containing protein [Rhodospirillaceae bacterium]MBT4488961.1 transporter substrate-binding domain-containing protein [Rhodospirillaceae bacterium]MBT5191868.1 transporter substrate-binding domain-containing protein [Rhodospirillaceae bacterium]MBT5897364.1 transporter substrate-binding domain-containing protein [Rhodospirillaceae bacterium]MBT6430850.1 transporter substrate-binding domain-containing protein [Rhodospirillaceae bacterium]